MAESPNHIACSWVPANSVVLVIMEPPKFIDGDVSPFAHEPVMVGEIATYARAIAPGVFVDLTLGGAGHSAAILESNEGLALHGIDQDEIAIEAATRRLAAFGDRAMIHRARFDRAAAVLEEAQVDSIQLFLMDLGVSSPQLDSPARGFSYRLDGPLDMRMDNSQTLTAADVVNGYSPGELIDVIRSYGDERHAKRIVDAIVARRPIATTNELAQIIADAIPAAARRKSTGHPAKRTFQAIRIEVNDELAILGSTIDAMVELLGPGGVGLVLTYHSGEDRIAKNRFRDAIDGDALPGMPSPSSYVWHFRGAQTPTDAEIEQNPRARSARLRAIRRLEAA